MPDAGGYSGRAAATWLRPREEMRGLIARHPREAVMLAFAMIAMFILFLARLPAALAMPRAAGLGPEAMVSAQFVSFVLFAPLFLYGIAALIRMVFTAVGGSGNWYRARLATFWAVLVTAPLQGVAILARHPALDVVAIAAGLWIWSGCLAEAEGISQLRAAAVLAAGVGLLVGLAWLLAAAS